MENKSNGVEIQRPKADSANVDVDIRRLAQLSAIDYERERETIAKRLGVRLSVLDRWVSAAKEQATHRSSPNVREGAGCVAPARSSGAKLFHSAEGTAFADVMVDGRRQTWQLSDDGFNDWLLHQYFLERRRAPALGSMKNAIRSLSAHATFEGEQHEVHLRVAESGGRIYLDLADAAWHVVEIDADGWRIIDDPPVRFRRTPGMRSMPLPQRGGTVHQLRPFVNLRRYQFHSVCRCAALRLPRWTTATGIVAVRRRRHGKNHAGKNLSTS